MADQPQRALVAALAAAMLLMGCAAVGPNYVAPDPAPPATWQSGGGPGHDLTDDARGFGNLVAATRRSDPDHPDRTGPAQ